MWLGIIERAFHIAAKSNSEGCEVAFNSLPRRPAESWYFDSWLFLEKKPRDRPTQFSNLYVVAEVSKRNLLAAFYGWGRSLSVNLVELSLEFLRIVVTIHVISQQGSETYQGQHPRGAGVQMDKADLGELQWHCWLKKNGHNFKKLYQTDYVWIWG